ncbi:MAG: hypothetical protein HUJ70_00805 [Pseudobutyrivibrio sp.]|nr:hypothetical protein [Pseudobutyrivibrio sp.]
MNTTAIAHQAQLQLWANRFKDHQEGGSSPESNICASGQSMPASVTFQ